jgi:methylenetetrahydrofolate dehydrogenase (NADP+)/methenyltetrahydrofolate cyclohydrolase
MLATVAVGDDPASHADVANKHRACAEVGIDSAHRALGEGASQEEVAECVSSLNDDQSISGVLIQLPLPGHLDRQKLMDLVDPDKDVDGLTTVNMGRLCRGSAGLVPCAPKAVLALLDHHKIEVEGKRAVVVGRSELVGRPIATLLSQRDATVTLCHSRTRELSRETRSADLLIVAAGKPGLIGRKHVREGGIVIDVGTHRADSGLVGFVDLERIRWRAGAVAPVPGGVAPLTVAALLDNTLLAAQAIETTGARSPVSS